MYFGRDQFYRDKYLNTVAWIIEYQIGLGWNLIKGRKRCCCWLFNCRVSIHKVFLFCLLIFDVRYFLPCYCSMSASLTNSTMERCDQNIVTFLSISSCKLWSSSGSSSVATASSTSPSCCCCQQRNWGKRVKALKKKVYTEQCCWPQIVTEWWKLRLNCLLVEKALWKA